MSDYDHHEKAGNQGDVVKHVALAAALDVVLKANDSSPFRYADTFAGYALNPLAQDNRGDGGWGGGVGALDIGALCSSGNPHVHWWATRYLKDQPLPGMNYPGSSVVARDVILAAGRNGHLSLWDTSDGVVADLRAHFSGGTSCHVERRPAERGEAGVISADLLFIDPPGLRSDHRREYPAWSELRAFLETRPPQQSLLMWLPVKAVSMANLPDKGPSRMTPPGEDDPSWSARNEAIRLGYRGIRVRWALGGRTIGCHLIYHLCHRAEAALREAVEAVVAAARWGRAIPKGVQSVIL